MHQYIHARTHAHTHTHTYIQMGIDQLVDNFEKSEAHSVANENGLSQLCKAFNEMPIE